MLTTLLPGALMAISVHLSVPAEPAARLPIRSVARAAAALAADSDYFSRGVAAQAGGDLEAARRAFLVAVALERDVDRLGTDASYALAHVLHLQSRHREAAAVLDDLASAAAARHDAETEARALLDALYLNVRAHRPWQARANAERLTVLARHDALSAATRKRIAAL